ncbi:MAG: 7,8-dihydro-6-hydroxymethylpterin dimethyltransferase [ANME-2 cluster archaeon]|nr:7,8-dihydro-6-hydroxymethylpterin dimethyltransferase [ANME-2 cluster archaeon]
MAFSPVLASKALWQLRVRKRPFVLSHGINARCNLRCKFCEYWKEEGAEMETGEILSLLDEARSFGIGAYNAWTAEPLLRKDLPEILKHAHDLGMMTSLITNGKLLKKRIPDLSDLDYLSVSLDGIKTFQEIRGFEFDCVLDGIMEAKEAGHSILLNCVISGKNLDELRNLVYLARDLGVWISFEPIHEFGGISGRVWDELGIRDMGAYRRAVDQIIGLKKSKFPIINSLTYLTMVKNLKPDFRCHASEIVLHVTADGRIENCRVARTHLGNVSDGILNVWKSSKDLRKRASEGCGGCLFFGYVENSLLYEFKPEVLKHYEWM